jgi:hypothetical protein
LTLRRPADVREAFATPTAWAVQAVRDLWKLCREGGSCAGSPGERDLPRTMSRCGLFAL